jgi:uncharacterized FlaG/YvyC family protein
MNDHLVIEAYLKAVQPVAPKKIEKTPLIEDELSEEQIDEAIQDIAKWINKLNWDSNPTLDQGDKKMAQRKAGELMMLIKEAEKCMEELEALVGSALSPALNKLVTKIVKDTI